MRRLVTRRRKLLLGGSGARFDPTVNPPIIFSATSVACDESATLSHTLTANEPISAWTIVGGVDAAKFEISGTTLRWAGNGVKDFESPDDSDANNVYIVNVRALDLQAQTTTQTITVTVLNLVDLATPTLSITSLTTDYTPDFTLEGDIAVGDLIRFQYSTSAVFSGASELTNTIDAAEDAANAINFSTGTLAVNTWYFRARVERTGFPNSSWSNTETITLTVPYEGPGNKVAGAKAWWGLRAYTTSLIGANAVELREDGGNTLQTFATVSGGGLNLTAISAFKGSNNLFVRRLFDQTGNGYDLLQATNASQPAFILGGLSGKPIITFNGTSHSLNHSSALLNVLDATFSAVANSTNNGTQQSLIFAATQIGYNNSGANTVFMYNGGVLTRAATDGSWHAIQAVFGSTSANSTINVDGVGTTGDAGTGLGAAITFHLSTTDGATSQPFKGSLVEGGYWNTTAFNSTQCSDMSSNQHTYWGFV